MTEDQKANWFQVMPDIFVTMQILFKMQSKNKIVESKKKLIYCLIGTVIFYSQMFNKTWIFLILNIPVKLA